MAEKFLGLAYHEMSVLSETFHAAGMFFGWSTSDKDIPDMRKQYYRLVAAVRREYERRNGEGTWPNH